VFRRGTSLHAGDGETTRHSSLLLLMFFLWPLSLITLFIMTADVTDVDLPDHMQFGKRVLHRHGWIRFGDSLLFQGKPPDLLPQ